MHAFSVMGLGGFSTRDASLGHFGSLEIDNLVGPASTYAVLNDFQTWVCTWAMLLGRLEIFTLMVLLIPAFWRS